MTGAQWSSSDEAFEYGENLLTDGVVQLRALAEADLDLLAAWWNESGWAALQQRIVKPRPVTPIREMFEAWSANKASGGDVGFSIHDVSTDELVGHATLYGASLPTRAAEYAILIGPPHVGRGLGTAATRLMLSYAFRELGLNRVELHVWAYNTRAVRTYEKAGFVVEGRRRQAAFHDGAFHDELIMGTLAEDHFAVRR